MSDNELTFCFVYERSKAGHRVAGEYVNAPSLAAALHAYPHLDTEKLEWASDDEGHVDWDVPNMKTDPDWQEHLWDDSMLNGREFCLTVSIEPWEFPQYRDKGE